MKKQVIIFDQLGCAYRWSEEWQQLEWAPLLPNGEVEDSWGTVDEDIVGEEIVMLDGKEFALSQIYREVEEQLGVK